MIQYKPLVRTSCSWLRHQIFELTVDRYARTKYCKLKLIVYIYHERYTLTYVNCAMDILAFNIAVVYYIGKTHLPIELSEVADPKRLMQIFQWFSDVYEAIYYWANTNSFCLFIFTTSPTRSFCAMK